MGIQDLNLEIAEKSLLAAQKEQGLSATVDKLRRIVPDISSQESRVVDNFGSFDELKRRNLHGFQCQLMMEALRFIDKKRFTVVDVGDSAGTHMLYLKDLSKDAWELDSLSINLDPRAIKKIRSRGLKALLKRAEEIDSADLDSGEIGFITSFEMIEHLHNPALFFRRLAKMSPCSVMVISVPFMAASRVGLHHIRNHSPANIYAEDEHVFELSPDDWRLLFLHSGWRTVRQKVYWQYPRKYVILRQLLGRFWRQYDYEGFWGAILVRDLSYSDRYLDWEA